MAIKRIFTRQVRTKNLLFLICVFILIIFLYLLVKTQVHFTNTFDQLTKKVNTPYNQPAVVTNPNKTKVKVSEKDTGKEINVNVGQQMTITLETGYKENYMWQLAAPIDTSVLKLTDVKFKEAKQNVTLSVPTEEWTFQGVKAGQTKIKLYYNSPWDKNSSTDKTESFLISVH